VIGTGASAVPAIPLIARDASHLTVFQRTANYIVPANNGPVPPEVVTARKADYDNICKRVRESNFGFELYFLEKGALEADDDEIERELMARWEQGGFGIWLGAYADISSSTRPTRRSASSCTTGSARRSRTRDGRAAHPQGLSLRRQAQPARLGLLTRRSTSTTSTSWK
jgi:hypothetical protein